MAELAINGGKKLREKDFPGWTTFTKRDTENLKAVYESGAWGDKGEQNRLFSREFAEFSGVKHCLAVANGTVSIELILRGLGIGRGDEVIVPAYTFIASISAIIYAGATPVFADIDPGTYNLSPAEAEKAITPRTKAIMPVYVGGRPADMYGFEKLCSERGLYLIGDGAQAVGSEYDGKGIGKFGIATSISCQNSKNLTCGEGGIIITDNDELYESIKCMLNLGRDGKGQYVSVGVRDTMSEFQASVLRTQLVKLPGEIARRMENAAYLDSRLRELMFISPLENDEKVTKNSYHLYMLRLDESKLGGISRARFLEALNAEGIPITPGYVPAYEFPCVNGEYAKKCTGNEIDITVHNTVAEHAGHHEGCWLYHAVLLGEKSDMDDIADGLKKVYENLDELR